MEILYNAKRDFLTNCYTRESLAPYLDKLLAENKAYKTEFSILLIDVDHFKPFNDKYGHQYGDEVLKYFSSSIRLGLADTESNVFRYGGDEFVIVLPQMNAKDAFKTALTLKETLRNRPFLLGGKLLKMSFSGGIASCATDGDSPQQILEKADKAMYISKKCGRARITNYVTAAKDRVMLALKALAALMALAAAGAVLWTFSSGLLSGGLPGIKVPNPFRGAGILQGAAGTVTVHMRSGSAIKGFVVKENDKEIEVKLALGKGEGSLTIKKANIKSIMRE